MKAMKLISRGSLPDFGVGKNFLNRAPTAQDLTTSVNSWDCMETKYSCTAKKTINRKKQKIYRLGENQ